MWVKQGAVDDPDWEEYTSKEFMSRKFGRCSLKVYLSYGGGYVCIAITAKNQRIIKHLDADDMDQALLEAEQWACVA